MHYYLFRQLPFLYTIDIVLHLLLRHSNLLLSLNK
jgi:hypothetical protein